MIPAVILAAGASSRMGRPKALLPIGSSGHTFLSRVVSTLGEAGLDDVIVVVGADGEAIRSEVERAGLDVRLVTNPSPERGQLSSLLLALEVVDRPGVRAMLVTLVDLPLVSVETVRLLVAEYRRTHAPIVRPARGGRHGHPVIFARSFFAELRAADPSAGANGVIAAHPEAVLDVEVADAGAFADVDTPEDYERITDGPSPS